MYHHVLTTSPLSTLTTTITLDRVVDVASNGDAVQDDSSKAIPVAPVPVVDEPPKIIIVYSPISAASDEDVGNRTPQYDPVCSSLNEAECPNLVPVSSNQHQACSPSLPAVAKATSQLPIRKRPFAEADATLLSNLPPSPFSSPTSTHLPIRKRPTPPFDSSSVPATSSPISPDLNLDLSRNVSPKASSLTPLPIRKRPAQSQQSANSTESPIRSRSPVKAVKTPLPIRKRPVISPSSPQNVDPDCGISPRKLIKSDESSNSPVVPSTSYQHLVPAAQLPLRKRLARPLLNGSLEPILSQLPQTSSTGVVSSPSAQGSISASNILPMRKRLTDHFPSMVNGMASTANRAGISFPLITNLPASGMTKTIETASIPMRIRMQSSNDSVSSFSNVPNVSIGDVASSSGSSKSLQRLILKKDDGNGNWSIFSNSSDAHKKSKKKKSHHKKKSVYYNSSDDDDEDEPDCNGKTVEQSEQNFHQNLSTSDSTMNGGKQAQLDEHAAYQLRLKNQLAMMHQNSRTPLVLPTTVRRRLVLSQDGTWYEKTKDSHPLEISKKGKSNVDKITISHIFFTQESPSTSLANNLPPCVPGPSGLQPQSCKPVVARKTPPKMKLTLQEWESVKLYASVTPPRACKRLPSVDSAKSKYQPNQDEGSCSSSDAIRPLRSQYSEAEYQAKLIRHRGYLRAARERETKEQHEERLRKKREYDRRKLETETPEERERRLKALREYKRKKRIAEGKPVRDLTNKTRRRRKQSTATDGEQARVQSGPSYKPSTNIVKSISETREMSSSTATSQMTPNQKSISMPIVVCINQESKQKV